MAIQPPSNVTYAASEQRRKAFLADLARIEQTTAARMRSEYETALRVITRRLDAKLAIIQARLAAGEDATMAISQAIMLDEQRAFIQQEIRTYATSAARILDDAGTTAAATGVTMGTAQLSGLTSDVFLPNAGIIEQMAARSAPGTALHAHLATMGERVADDIISELVQGTIRGEHPSVVARTIKAKLQEPGTRIITMVRTETLGAARDAMLATYRANPDIVKGWIWNAEEDGRTCAVCWAMNGTEHTRNEPFVTHVNCRCTPDPWTYSFSEILGRPIRTQDTSLEPFSGDDRFRAQPESVQRKVLGPSKFAAYQSGALPNIDALVGRSVHPMWGPALREKTLGELGLPRVR